MSDALLQKDEHPHSKSKIAGVVILYHPEADAVDNIKTYAGSLDCLFVVNNEAGENVISELLNDFDHIHVIQEKENMGIAYPLNQVLKLCDGKYDFLLTMDQDSAFHGTDIEKYIDSIPQFDWRSTLGIAPKKINKNVPVPVSKEIKWLPVFRTITSGNMVNVHNAIDIGGYNEDLFIDEVDHDFCYRGHEKGFQTIVCTEGIYLTHQLGNRIYGSIIGKNFNTLNHGAVRKYYIIRNCLYTYKRFAYLNRGFFTRVYICNTIKNIVKIPLVEKDKLRKLKYCAWGFWDFLNHKVGKKNFN